MPSDPPARETNPDRRPGAPAASPGRAAAAPATGAARLTTALIARVRSVAARRRRSILVAQAVLSLAGFGYVVATLITVTNEAPARLGPQLATAVAAVLPLGLLGLPVRAFRWRAWLRLGSPAPVPLLWTLRVVTVANFLGAISIGTLAKDVYRVGTAVASGRTLRRSFAATFLDRMSGAATQVALAFLAVALVAGDSRPALLAGLAAALGVIGAMALVILSGRLPLPGRAQNALVEARARGDRLARRVGRRRLLGTLAISVAATALHILLQSAAIFAAAGLLGWSLRLEHALAIGLIQSAVGIVPWAFQGLGLRDASLFAALALLGAPAAIAAAVSVSLRAAALLVALSGATVYLAGKLPPLSKRAPESR